MTPAERQRIRRCRRRNGRVVLGIEVEIARLSHMLVWMDKVAPGADLEAKRAALERMVADMIDAFEDSSR